MTKKYYKVTCKGGHVTRRYYIPIDIYVAATSRAEAAAIARTCPRVKHDHIDAVIDAVEIDRDSYIAGMRAHQHDPYYRAACRQDQRMVDLAERIVEDPHFYDRDAHRQELRLARKERIKTDPPKPNVRRKRWKAYLGYTLADIIVS